MHKTLEAVVDEEGNITLLEEVRLKKTCRALVIILGREDEGNSLDSVWNNEDDDIYGELLEK